jgi:replicative DNA helicase
LSPDGRTKTIDGAIGRLLLSGKSAEQHATRIISEQTELPSYRILRGEIDPSDFDRIAQMARDMETIPLYIDETGGISIAQLTARARRLSSEPGRGSLFFR